MHVHDSASFNIVFENAQEASYEPYALNSNMFGAIGFKRVVNGVQMIGGQCWLIRLG